jgi:hypothetical protein
MFNTLKQGGYMENQKQNWFVTLMDADRIIVSRFIIRDADKESAEAEAKDNLLHHEKAADYSLTELGCAKRMGIVPLYKVVRIFKRRPGVREILYRDKCEDEAQWIVQSFPDRNLSMVVYFKQ